MVKAFWWKLAGNLAAKIIAPILLWLTHKGIITDDQSAQAVLYATAAIGFGAQTIYTRLVNRWNADFAREAGKYGASRATVAHYADLVNWWTKIKEAATRGPNPTAVQVAAEITRVPNVPNMPNIPPPPDRKENGDA